MSQAPSEFKDYWALVNRDVRFSHTAFIFFFFFFYKTLGLFLYFTHIARLLLTVNGRYDLWSWNLSTTDGISIHHRWRRPEWWDAICIYINSSLWIYCTMLGQAENKCMSLEIFQEINWNRTKIACSFDTLRDPF